MSVNFLRKSNLMRSQLAKSLFRRVYRILNKLQNILIIITSINSDLINFKCGIYSIYKIKIKD